MPLVFCPSLCHEYPVVHLLYQSFNSVYTYLIATFIQWNSMFIHNMMRKSLTEKDLAISFYKLDSVIPF